MTKLLADALVPIFAGLLLGYCAGVWRKMDNQDVKTLITFVMSFAIPCSLFLAIAGTPRTALRAQAAPALVLAAVYCVLYGLTFLWTRFKENLNNADSSVVAWLESETWKLWFNRFLLIRDWHARRVDRDRKSSWLK
jgi:malonate transporter and related proteins